jgi:hypothetical protein
MVKIKATYVTFNAAGTMFVVDDLGQLWMRAEINRQWSKVDLPEQA